MVDGLYFQGYLVGLFSLHRLAIRPWTSFILIFLLSLLEEENLKRFMYKELEGLIMIKMYREVYYTHDSFLLR